MIRRIKDPNEAYKRFIAIVTSIYEPFLPKSRIKIKKKKLNKTPWITRGIAQSSKRKQKLYKKLLINCTRENEMNYKNYRRLFKSVKQKSKIFFYLWKIMKEVIGKARKTQPFFRAKFLLKVH